jgi:hypothetical protein
VDYVQRVVGYAVGVVNKVEILGKNWQGLMEEIARNCTVELSMPQSINEETLNGLLKKC